MEDDDFDFLAPAYVRGFLRSYANFLGFDPTPLLTEFDARHEVDRVQTQQLLDLDTPRQAKGAKNAGGALAGVAAATGSMSAPSRISNWTVAAIIALIAIIGLAVVGILNPADKNTATNKGPRSKVAAAPSPTPSVTPSATASTSRKPSTKTLAQAGMKVTLDATNGDCWILVVSDGQTAGQVTLTTGQSRTFTADHKMYIRLGNAGAVTLTVNGHKLGSVGAAGQVVDLTLPDDIKNL